MAQRLAVGSTDWISAEQNNYKELLQQEREEIVFPAQHELEWLNEHMNEIFNNSYLDVANVFKTPGKLKGKTPHTARKRNIEARIPLSDIFQSKRDLLHNSNKANRPVNFTTTTANDTLRIKSQADSGYHGSSQIDPPTKSPTRSDHTPGPRVPTATRTTEGSFHSAKEDQTTRVDIQSQSAPLQDVAPESPIIDHQMQDIELPNFEDIGSPSDQSTPERPAVRKKSSMTFASLPAREPLKTSIGVRTSSTSHLAARKTSPRTASEMLQTEMDIDDSNIEILGHDDSDTESQVTKQHSRISTQRLHEKIGALGKSAPAVPTKTLTAATAVVGVSNSNHTIAKDLDQDEDEEEWIQPLYDGHSPHTHPEMDDEDELDIRAPELIAHEERMRQYSPSPQRPALGHTKSASTTTLVSPTRLTMAPPPSPAKSISMSNPMIPTTTPQGSPSRFLDGVSASKSKLQSIMKTAKGLFTSSASLSAAAKMETVTPKTDRIASDKMSVLDKPLPMSPVRSHHQTRESIGRQKRHMKDLDAIQKMEEQLSKAREKETWKARGPSPFKDDERIALKPARPIPFNRDATKPKPQPVSIRVGTISQRLPPATETLPADPKRSNLTSKASSASIHSTAPGNILKTSTASQSVKPRALVAAERKKEQDLREAQRKLDQKRDTERKRAAQQEEARRREQEERIETERRERERLAQERAKRQAQQQAIEKKRFEASRKAEQQRIEREGSRPPSRMGQQINRPLVNHPLPTNPAKPAKRPMEEEIVRPQASKFGVTAQQADAKRRRTEDEPENISRPTMSGAPIRQSQLGKKPSIFSHPVYQQAPTSQFPQPPSRAHPMAQYATSKIPFADTMAAPTKTPVSAYPQRTIQAIRSSPQYQNGESIHLPEIPTDSEDEDSEDEGNSFPVPDWATPGHLTEQLIRQEGMDGDAVFGPIAPLKMEEIFAKGNKDRLKRLRDRTSSANWAMSGDGLTLEEVRADREQREKMRLEGGWRYGT